AWNIHHRQRRQNSDEGISNTGIRQGSGIPFPNVNDRSVNQRQGPSGYAADLKYDSQRQYFDMNDQSRQVNPIHNKQQQNLNNPPQNFAPIPQQQQSSLDGHFRQQQRINQQNSNQNFLNNNVQKPIDNLYQQQPQFLPNFQQNEQINPNQQNFDKFSNQQQDSFNLNLPQNRNGDQPYQFPPFAQSNQYPVDAVQQGLKNNQELPQARVYIDQQQQQNFIPLSGDRSAYQQPPQNGNNNKRISFGKSNGIYRSGNIQMSPFVSNGWFDNTNRDWFLNNGYYVNDALSMTGKMKDIGLSNGQLVLSKLARVFRTRGEKSYPKYQITDGRGTVCTNVENFEGFSYGQFPCPLPDTDPSAVFCCGEKNRQYCCTEQEFGSSFSKFDQKRPLNEKTISDHDRQPDGSSGLTSNEM
ncbi:unnamed protein product, partial [Didymodactylos carnosus]